MNTYRITTKQNGQVVTKEYKTTKLEWAIVLAQKDGGDDAEILYSEEVGPASYTGTTPNKATTILRAIVESGVQPDF